jgi:hypothetical protein
MVNLYLMKLEFRTGMMLRIHIFWGVTVWCWMSNSHHFEGSCHLHRQWQTVQLVLDCLTLKMKLLWSSEIVENTMQWHSATSQLETWTSMFHYKEMSWQMNNSLRKNLYQNITQLPGVFAHFTQKTHITMWFSKIWTVSLCFMAHQWAVPQVTFCWTSFISAIMS